MSLTEILIGLVLGAVVNEACDVSPWLARRLLRWSAHQISDADMAERYEEEWLGLLDERPGKLLKLTFALWITLRSTRTLRGLYRTRTVASAPTSSEDTESTSQRRRSGHYVRGHYRMAPRRRRSLDAALVSGLVTATWIFSADWAPLWVRWLVSGTVVVAAGTLSYRTRTSHATRGFYVRSYRAR